MKKLILAVAAATLAGAGFSSIAADNKMSGQGMMGMKGMKQFDSNGDKMLSKEEFMTGHEQMFDRMKGQDGMISLENMQMNCMKMMMGQGGMMSEGGMMGNQGDAESQGGMMGNDSTR
jgi:hypothetical protein